MPKIEGGTVTLPTSTPKSRTAYIAEVLRKVKEKEDEKRMIEITKRLFPWLFPDLRDLMQEAPEVEPKVTAAEEITLSVVRRAGTDAYLLVVDDLAFEIDEVAAAAGLSAP